MAGSSPLAFISYARKDGELFATALKRRLTTDEPGITLWQDRAELEGGVGWWKQIKAALDQVKFLIIVMTPGAIVSPNTQDEWREARLKGVIVYPVKGAPDSELDYASLPNWIRKAHFFDVGTYTDEGWRDGKEWSTFVNYLKSDRQPVRVPFMAPELPVGFVARTRELEQLLTLLLAPARGKLVSLTTALHGAGGYGKTTLATALCHDQRIKEAFDDGVLWVSLGETPRLVDELARLYEALTGQRPSFIDVTQAASQLAETIEHLDCLLVIDDVWDRDHLQPFLKGGARCARLVTSRQLDLVSDTARVLVDEMSAAESIALLETVFPPGIVPRGRLEAIARRLGEWPLLLNLAKGLAHSQIIRGDTAEVALKHIERVFDKRGVTAFDRKDAKQRDQAVRRTVAASKDQLQPQDSERLHELAIFPEETPIPLSTLERLWGLDDIDTKECAQRLDNLALIKLDLRQGIVTLHDVMRAYLLEELGAAQPVHARLVAAYADPMRLPDEYAWRWLPYHMLHGGLADDLKVLLLRPEWLYAKAQVVGARALLADFNLIGGDADVAAVEGTLRLALPILVSDVSQFAEQFLARLRDGGSERLHTFTRTLAAVAPPTRLHPTWSSLTSEGSGLVQTLGRQGPISGLLLLPDDRPLSWSSDGKLRLWDVASGDVRALTGHGGEVGGALLLPDDHLLSWSNDCTLRVWDLNGGEVRVLSGHSRPVRGALVLPDGLLSWSADATLRSWDLVSGESHVLSGHKAFVDGALLLDDGCLLSWSTDGTLRIWDLDSRESSVLAGHESWVSGALLLRDGRPLSWSGDGTLRIWDLATGKPQVLAGHESSVRGATLLADGSPLSWSADGTLRIWQLGSDRCRVLTGHERGVSGVLLLPGDRLLSWSVDGTLRLWNSVTGEGRALAGHQSEVQGALPVSAGHALSWGDRTLRLWDLATGKDRVLTGHEGLVSGAVLLRDGRSLSWSEDGTLRIWDLAAHKGRETMGHRQRVRSALLLPTGNPLSWSDDGTLRLWDPETGEGRELTGHKGDVVGTLLLGDGRPLSWSRDGTLRLWDLVTGEGQELAGHEGPVSGVFLLRDGRVLSWSVGRTVLISDLATGESRTLIVEGDRISAALMLPDGRLLSWDSFEDTLRILDLDIGKARTLTGHEDRVAGALLLPDGRPLSWSTDGTLRAWNVMTGEVQVLRGHERGVDGAHLLSDGRPLSCSTDGTFRLWDLRTSEGRAVATHGGEVVGVRPLPNGHAVWWEADGRLMFTNCAGGASSVTRHEEPIIGVLPLPDGRVLSWGGDRTLRLSRLDNDGQIAVFTFDTVVTTVLTYDHLKLFVGDLLGGVHFLEIVEDKKH